MLLHAEPEGRQWAEAWRSRQAAGLTREEGEEERCGRELGRWITPFRRRVGRWLTDITPLWPLLSSRQCR
jgi:hypothetical protein